MTADTSAVIAALSAWHEHHEPAAEALADVDALPGHALTETYAVLTRLPGGLAVPGPVAADVLAARFPGAALRLDRRAERALPATLAAAGVIGGSSYDGVVSLQAAAAGEPLITLDTRALTTYRRLGVDAVLIPTG
jgi:predicted nucleic acid-binding protein